MKIEYKLSQFLKQLKMIFQNNELKNINLASYFYNVAPLIFKLHKWFTLYFYWTVLLQLAVESQYN